MRLGLPREEAAKRVAWKKRVIDVERLDDYLLLKRVRKEKVDAFHRDASVKDSAS